MFAYCGLVVEIPTSLLKKHSCPPSNDNQFVFFRAIWMTAIASLGSFWARPGMCAGDMRLAPV